MLKYKQTYKKNNCPYERMVYVGVGACERSDNVHTLGDTYHKKCTINMSLGEYETQGFCNAEFKECKVCKVLFTLIKNIYRYRMSRNWKGKGIFSMHQRLCVPRISSKIYL